MMEVCRMARDVTLQSRRVRMGEEKEESLRRAGSNGEREREGRTWLKVEKEEQEARKVSNWQLQPTQRPSRRAEPGRNKERRG